MPLPDKIKNAPDLLLGLGLYYRAFLDLTTCRPLGFGSEGPISWQVIQEWARTYELDEEQTEELHYHIPRMDEVYLKHKAKKMESKTKMSSPKKAKGR